MSLGRNIKILCFDKQITQRELADAAGVSQKMISKIVMGESIPSVMKLSKIAERLGVSIDELLK